MSTISPSVWLMLWLCLLCFLPCVKLFYFIESSLLTGSLLLKQKAKHSNGLTKKGVHFSHTEQPGHHQPKGDTVASWYRKRPTPFLLCGSSIPNPWLPSHILRWQLQISPPYPHSSRQKGWKGRTKHTPFLYFLIKFFFSFSITYINFSQIFLKKGFIL